MQKMLIGPQLRQLRKAHKQTQAQMAARLGISAAYVNLLESNQRSMSVQVLVALTEAYGVDWRGLVGDGEEKRIPELRSAMRDPIFTGEAPDLQELRAALDHAPRLVSRFLQIYDSHRNLTDRLGRQAGTGILRPVAGQIDDPPGPVIGIALKQVDGRVDRPADRRPPA